MARKPRVHFNGAIFHITARGVRRQTLFHDAQDYGFFMDLVEKVKKELPFRLLAYCLIPNHIHLVLQVIAETAGKILHQLLLPYARYYNRRYGWSGHVFDARHFEKLCRKDRYFLALLRYVHQNPIPTLAKRPEQWEWSGHRELSGTAPQRYVDVDFPLKILHEDKTQARRRYRRLLETVPSRRLPREAYVGGERQKWKRPLRREGGWLKGVDVTGFEPATSSVRRKRSSV